MKKLLFFILFGLTHAYAMEAPSTNNQEGVEITITAPEKSSTGNFMHIIALDGKIQVGYITFCQKTNPTEWNLLALNVHQEYRKNHIAQTLIKECLKYIKSQGAKLLVWKALPLDRGIKLHTLINIYRRLIESAGYTMDSLTLGTRKGSGLVQQIKMRLTL